MQPPETPAIEIVQLPVEEWQAYRALRLEALSEAPQAFGSTYLDQVDKLETFWQARLEAAARGEDSCLLFARMGERLVGMMGAFRETAGTDMAEIVSVYVSPSARGLGVGARLMEAILETLQRWGVRRARLGVNIEQTAAVRLYQRFGFREVERVRHTMGDGAEHDEVFMECELPRQGRQAAGAKNPPSKK